MLDRSRWPAHSAIATSAFRAPGARTIRASWRGSMHLRKPCPRLRRPLLRRGEAEARIASSESIFQPATQYVVFEFDIVDGLEAAVEAALVFAEVDVEIFSLCGPTAQERDLETGTDRPARMGFTHAGKAGR